MKITNKFGLPEPLVNAVKYSTYTKGEADFSVTELIKPPRIAALEILHDEALEEDASDRLWMLMGSAGHEVLRRSSNGGIVEERCIVEFEGKKISGQLDYAVALKEIIDYKFVSLWAIRDGVKPEWEQQLNLYKWMAEQYGVTVESLKIIGILRDWSKPEARRNPDLPQSQVVVLPVRIWETHMVQDFLRIRIHEHEQARSGNLPFCTPEETWERLEKYAAMKKGNQRASKVEDTKFAIGQWIASQAKPSQFEIEVRPAERPRCESYCPCSGVCEQFNDWKKGQQ
jgi:hypothetical protein